MEKNHFAAKPNPDKKPFTIVLPPPNITGQLHMGHALDHVIQDVLIRFKRMQGFNVLHPMGYDAYGLPAEQYAIQTGQHPAITTEANIKTYRKQLDKIGFSFDWSREVRTSDPNYYKWTQWIFIQLFESYYCKDADQARAISELEEVFASEGNSRINAVCDEDVEIFKECENYIKKNINGKNILVSDLYALKNKDPLVSIIYNNPIKWRAEYYKAIFNTNITLDSSIITSAVLSYIEGIAIPLYII